MSESSEQSPFRLRRPGGDVDPNRIFNVPGVILAIVGSLVAIYVLLAFLPERTALLVEFTAAVSPQRLMLGAERNGGWLSMLSPLIAHMFMHANIPHLFFNSLWLVALGAPIARRMGAEYALKSMRSFYSASLFLTFFLLSGIVGALTFVALHLNETTFLIGASGGVSGLLGGVVRFAFNRTSLLGADYAKFSRLFSRPVVTWSIFVVISNILFGLFSGPLTGGAAIAWEAHLGGYFFGLLTYPFFEYMARGR
ncbi:MAG: rhomboid family intramembrane serine protease [Alphaproteobacteria bacterium]|nr:rhomboid family intramembrane serine protease [Alphaproteobacteria bacterium]